MGVEGMEKSGWERVGGRSGLKEWIEGVGWNEWVHGQDRMSGRDDQGRWKQRGTVSDKRTKTNVRFGKNVDVDG